MGGSSVWGPCDLPMIGKVVSRSGGLRRVTSLHSQPTSSTPVPLGESHPRTHSRFGSRQTAREVGRLVVPVTSRTQVSGLVGATALLCLAVASLLHAAASDTGTSAHMTSVAMLTTVSPDGSGDNPGDDVVGAPGDVVPYGGTTSDPGIYADIPGPGGRDFSPEDKAPVT